VLTALVDFALPWNELHGYYSPSERIIKKFAKKSLSTAAVAPIAGISPGDAGG
jgi:hypothetical protein